MTGVTERHPLLRTSPIKVMNANSRLHQATGTPMLEKLEQIIIIRQGCPVHARVSDDQLPPSAVRVPLQCFEENNGPLALMVLSLPESEYPRHLTPLRLGPNSVALRRKTFCRSLALTRGQDKLWSLVFSHAPTRRNYPYPWRTKVIQFPCRCQPPSSLGRRGSHDRQPVDTRLVHRTLTLKQYDTRRADRSGSHLSYFTIGLSHLSRALDNN